MRRWLPLLPLLCLVASPADAGESPVLVAHVTVREPGDYRISEAALKKLGIPAAAFAELRLFGQAVDPCRGSGPDLFLRVPRSGNRSSGLTTYELWRLPAARLPQTGGPGPTGALFGAMGHDVLDRDRVYGELAAADPAIYAAPGLPVWFLTSISPRKPATLTLAPFDGLAQRGQTLVAQVFAAHRGTVAIRATWGGADLGTATRKNAAGGGLVRWEVPAGKVPSGPAPLALVDVSPAPPPAPTHDVSHGRRVLYIDSLRIEGVRKAPPPRTCDAAARELTPRATRAVRDPLLEAGKAQHVILATPPLVDGAKRLAQHRRETGVPSVVIALADIYDGPYGYGNRSPNAIVKFIDALRSRPGVPLRYVVLAGDATFDRTDFGPEITLPTPMGRTMYNGATSADRLYVLPEQGATGGPSIGRLPFRTASEMSAYVDRVIRYETKPPAHATRRLLRFITSEGRFGGFIDGMMERQFRTILAKDVPPAFDVEVTFASEKSPFLWPPPAFNDKVIEGLNEGALFYTYVGHGFAQGFDTLRIKGQRYPILHVSDAPRIKSRGTPPIVLVLACTTAMFDGMRGDGVGEALLKQADGPVAYWGATRVCHPIYNTWVGQALARRIATGPPLDRLGDILDAARDDVLQKPPSGAVGIILKNFAGIRDMGRLMREGSIMYALLGDPALKVALPRNDVRVSEEGTQEKGVVRFRVSAPLPDGTKIHVSLELPRNRSVEKPKPARNPQDPKSFEKIRRTHARMNDWALARAVLFLKDGVAEGTLALDPAGEDAVGKTPDGVGKVSSARKGLIVKAWARTPQSVHQGALVLR